MGRVGAEAERTNQRKEEGQPMEEGGRGMEGMGIEQGGFTQTKKEASAGSHHTIGGLHDSRRPQSPVIRLAGMGDVGDAEVQDQTEESGSRSLADLVGNEGVQQQHQGSVPEGKSRKGRAYSVTARQLYEMLKQQEFRCSLTGRDLTPQTAVVDHAVPLSRGGLHDIGNLVAIHAEVNTAKASMTTDEFVAMCVEVALESGKCSLIAPKSEAKTG